MVLPPRHTLIDFDLFPQSTSPALPIKVLLTLSWSFIVGGLLYFHLSLLSFGPMWFEYQSYLQILTIIRTNWKHNFFWRKKQNNENWNAPFAWMASTKCPPEGNLVNFLPQIIKIHPLRNTLIKFDLFHRLLPLHFLLKS